MTGSASTTFLLIGNILWLATYLLAIRRSFADRLVAFPIVATCLNFSWELYYSTGCFPLHLVDQADGNTVNELELICGLSDRAKLIAWLWLAADAVILWQAILFAPARLENATLRKHFVPMLMGGVLVCYGFHFCFSLFYLDRNGTQDAWLINLIMSVLFVRLLFTRSPSGKGQSYIAAWTRGAGNLFLAIGLATAGVRALGPAHVWHVELMYFLFLCVLVADIVYIAAFTVIRTNCRRGSSP